MKLIDFIKTQLKEGKIVSSIAKVIEGIILITITIMIVYTIYEFITTISEGFIIEIINLVGNAFLLVVLLEIFQSIVDFDKGKGRSVIYIMDATISFLLREIIIEVFNGALQTDVLLTYAGLIITITASRFLISMSRRQERAKRIENRKSRRKNID